MKAVKNIISIFFIGLGVIALSYQTVYLTSAVETDAYYYVFAFCITVFAYFFRRNERYLKVISYLFFLSALVFMFHFSIEFNLLILILLLSASFYFLVPKRYSIRNFTYLKPIFIPMIWVLMSVILPLNTGFAGNALPDKIFIFLIGFERFFFLLALALSTDIIDIAYDMEAGLITIPIKHGIYATIILLEISLGLAATFSVVSFTIGYYSAYFMAAVTLSLIISGILLPYLLSKSNKQDIKMAIDAMMILQCSLVIIAGLVFS